MASFKIVISDPKTGKSEVLEAKDSQAQIFMGRKIGEVIDLSVIGQNYKVKLTGGSDRAGFPMRGDVMGSGKRHVLMTEGIGFRHSVRRREAQEAGQGRHGDRRGLPAQRRPLRVVRADSASLSIPGNPNFLIIPHGPDYVHGTDDAHPQAA